MIVDKNNGGVVSGNLINSQNQTNVSEEEVEVVNEQSEMPDNSLIDVHNAIKEILQGVTWKYNDPKSDKIFQYVKYNGGQHSMIVSGDTNPIGEMGFPAALINFINIRWTSNQNTINEGSAELRIQILMNTLNNYDDDKETEMYYVCQRVIQSIQEQKYDYPQLLKKCKLEFMDTATSYHSGIQSCWLTYSIQFREISIWTKRNRVKRFIVCPPFTNHSDQTDPSLQNILHHTDSDHVVSYDSVTKFIETLED